MQHGRVHSELHSFVCCTVEKINVLAVPIHTTAPSNREALNYRSAPNVLECDHVYATYRLSKLTTVRCIV
jgi:hypothetical protein